MAKREKGETEQTDTELARDAVKVWGREESIMRILYRTIQLVDKLTRAIPVAFNKTDREQIKFLVEVLRALGCKDVK